MLAHVGEGLGEMKSLRHLDLSFNRLTSLPVEVAPETWPGSLLECVLWKEIVSKYRERSHVHLLKHMCALHFLSEFCSTFDMMCVSPVLFLCAQLGQLTGLLTLDFNYNKIARIPVEVS